MFKTVESRFRQMIPKVDFCSLRLVDRIDHTMSVRQQVPEPVYQSRDIGAMITVVHHGGLGYGATADLSVDGLKKALEQATGWAQTTAGRGVTDFSKIDWPSPTGEFAGPEKISWDAVSLEAKFDRLRNQCRQLKVDDRVVDCEASLWYSKIESLYLTSHGGRVYQKISQMAPSMYAIANEKTQTQQRSSTRCLLGGMEIWDQLDYETLAPKLGREAVELLTAPNCPSGKMDVLLMPDQMILQIHESVGHPLELDRILGDERNYAGTSFVTPDMFGSYQYGSGLLNITFDPTRRNEFASYGYDDDGSATSKVYLIEKGILKSGIGGIVSQTRSGLPGTSSSRATSWNRPPIDRMANINLEPGGSSLDEMIASIRHGVLMTSNCSWSIDDSRNKFQFGCEWGRLIEDGKLTTVVRNPNYRGISATFWRSLKMVGDESTFVVLGTPNCGKGEPNQIIKTGHATPACVFADVEVFGGEQ
jgi:predicted Zn-dependent protease